MLHLCGTSPCAIQDSLWGPSVVDVLSYICFSCFVVIRSIGIPAKGHKSDLISALRSYLDKKIEGAALNFLIL